MIVVGPRLKVASDGVWQTFNTKGDKFNHLFGAFTETRDNMKVTSIVFGKYLVAWCTARRRK